MNERIKQLAEKATVLDYSTWDSHNQKTVDHYKFDKEKFAELIVKECAGVAEVSMPVNSHPDDRLMVKNRVLQHFGVEE